MYNLENFSFDYGRLTFKNPHGIIFDTFVRSGLLGFFALIFVFFKLLSTFVQSGKKFLLVGLFVVFLMGTAFSFSVYGKEFVLSVFSMLIFFYFMEDILRESGSDFGQGYGDGSAR